MTIALSKDVYVYVEATAICDGVTIEEKAKQLIEKAIEVEEDKYLSKIADERDTKTAHYLSQEEFWS